MNQYESMYIIDAALEDQVRKDLIDKFAGVITSNGGEVLRIDEWGRRRLAYQIDYKTEGFYVLVYLKGPAELPKELERNYAISDSVLRYLTVRFDGALPPKREALRPAPVAAAPVEGADAPEAAPDAPAQSEPAEPVSAEQPDSAATPEAAEQTAAEQTAAEQTTADATDAPEQPAAQE